jgi:hypothetical protein
MAGATHIRLGGIRYELRAGGSISDPCEILAAITRGNLRAYLEDPRIRAEVLRRLQSPPCPVRCYVSTDGARNDCTCSSGFQYTSDPEQQASIGCEARDVWNDARALLVTHEEAGRGANDPIMVDCDCITTTGIAGAAWLAWYEPHRAPLAGIDLAGIELAGPPAVTSLLAPPIGSAGEAQFAIGITLPAEVPGRVRVGHCYGLVNRKPKPPQPPIQMPFAGGPWWVWDLSAHFGMNRPSDDFYTTGEAVAFPVVHEGLFGLRASGRR